MRFPGLAWTLVTLLLEYMILICNKCMSYGNNKIPVISGIFLYHLQQ